MKLGNKGYSIVELFAVIFLVSLVLLPLLNTLVNNITNNARTHDRRAAVSIAQGTLDGFNRVEFSNVEALIEAQNDAGAYYLDFDINDCSELSASDVGLCQQLFSTSWSNFEADADHFKLYFYNYRLTTDVRDNLLANANIPDAVKSHIESVYVDGSSNIVLNMETDPDLFYIICWIEYDDDSNLAIVMEGLISDDQYQ